jgi:hypothetical protein
VLLQETTVMIALAARKSLLMSQAIIQRLSSGGMARSSAGLDLIGIVLHSWVISALM